MNAVKRILVPVDFSEGSRAALDRAVTFAKTFGASIDLLHAWETPVYVGNDALVAGAGAVSASIAEHSRRVAEERLREWKDALRARGFPDAKALLVNDDTASAILEQAAKGYDLVVVGTHGRTGFLHVALGSVAERVVRHCLTPVLTVRAATADPDHTSLTAGGSP